MHDNYFFQVFASETTIIQFNTITAAAEAPLNETFSCALRVCDCVFFCFLFPTQTNDWILNTSHKSERDSVHFFNHFCKMNSNQVNYTGKSLHGKMECDTLHCTLHFIPIWLFLFAILGYRKRLCFFFSLLGCFIFHSRPFNRTWI